MQTEPQSQQQSTTQLPACILKYYNPAQRDNNYYLTKSNTTMSDDPTKTTEINSERVIIRQRFDPEGLNVIFVKGLPHSYDITEDIIRAAFQPWGKVINVTLVHETMSFADWQQRNNIKTNNNISNPTLKEYNHQQPPITRSYAFVSFQKESQAEAVIKAAVDYKLLLPIISPTQPIGVDFYHSDGNTGFEDIDITDNNNTDNIFQPSNRNQRDLQQLLKF